MKYLAIAAWVLVYFNSFDGTAERIALYREKQTCLDQASIMDGKGYCFYTDESVP